MNPIRPASVAGRFYPASAAECTRMLGEMIRPLNLPANPIGAVVPHAGWVFSGATALLGIQALAQAEPETVVIFGAVHTIDPNYASLYARGSWETPIGVMSIDEELASSFARLPHIETDPDSHRDEHSIEVQLPIIRRILGDVSVVPLSVRPSQLAAEIGRSCGQAVRESGRRVVFLASTDLTHYGPAFAFEPHGRGEAGIRWSKEVNDRRFIDLLAAMDADAVVSEASVNRNACGPGAVAAGIAACRELGADRYVELEHTTSAEQDLSAGGQPMNSVGYEVGVFTRTN